MKIAVDVNTMRCSDSKTIESGIPSKILMYNAGKSIVSSYNNWGKTAVVCGPGNNGGDGFVIASLLKETDNDVTVFLTQDYFSEDGRFYFEKCKELNIQVYYISSDTSFDNYDTVVDCIFGTGFRATPTGNELIAINKINASGSYVISADINSGMSGDTGLALGECVVSDLTVSLGYFKVGHFLGDSKDYIKKLINCDIGIDLYGKSVGVTERNDFKEFLINRNSNAHKGTFGYVGVIGGCTEYCGALKLSNIAASTLRSGCGVVKLGVAKSLVGAVSPYLLESTLFVFDDNNGEMVFDETKILNFIKNLRSISCGMGWGTGKDNLKILKYISENFDGALIIDADGLNALSYSGSIDVFCEKSLCKKIVITPHPLEFSRLSGYSLDEILSNPVYCAQKFASEFNGKVIVLLKGSGTVITDGNETIISTSGCPGMATAGSGDILSGIMAGIMGYNEPTVKSVACAAYIAGLSGELAEQEIGSISMTASDTLRHIPFAIKLMQQ